MKKVPVVKIATPDTAAALAGLSFDATVAMADVAGAMRDGLLAFSAAAGLVVMRLFANEGVAGSCRRVNGSHGGVVEVFHDGGSLRQPSWRPRPCATLPLMPLM